MMMTMNEHQPIGFRSFDFEIHHCKVMITTMGNIGRGEYIQPTPQGTVQKCTIREILTDPFGDIHFPHIMGYTIDAIKDGGIGRAVVTMF